MLSGAKGIALRIIKLCLFNYIDASYDLLQMPCDISKNSITFVEDNDVLPAWTTKKRR